MDQQRWKTIKDILDVALALEPVERGIYLEKTCGSDRELLAEVESLLSFDDPAVDAFEETAFSSVFPESGRSLIGVQIDKYKLISELGIGGMGSVFLAERIDGTYDQKVALKLIKRGMDSDAILHRFFTERQILASLQHPNIAHLIDGGTTSDGLPFFVMEFVDGVSIIEFARRENLDLTSRLELFREVCSAVTFAHQNLVIHRDLKPSNILVTKSGSPKLLDFGIAKLLRSDSEGFETATKNFIFTPEYASPEQVRGDKLTTATDVYSLGVILYELLTGIRPHKTDSKNISEVIHAVCENEPEKPSSVIIPSKTNSRNRTRDNIQPETKGETGSANPQALRGDLDNIILKALRKEPERRYSSVEQLSGDIRRHLDGLPVTATADTFSYRASKFLRRNRIGVAAAALILLSLIGGLAATLYQARKAEQRFNDVRQLANSFLFEFHDAIENLPGSTPARELVVKRGIEYLDKLAADSGNDPTILRELATAYEKVGTVQGNSYYSNLGDAEGAMKSYSRSLEIRQKLADANPNDRTIQHELASSHEGVGDMHYTDNKLNEGLQSYEKAVTIREAILTAEPENRDNRYGFAVLLQKHGDIKGMEGFPNLGDTQGALASYSRAASLAENLLDVDPENKQYRFTNSSILSYYTMLLTATGDMNGAIESGKRSVAITESLVAAEPNNPKYETQLMATLSTLRYPLLDEGRIDEAIGNARRVVSTMEKQSAADPKNAFARRSLSVSYNALGLCLLRAGDAREAVENHRRSLDIVEEFSAADSSNNEILRDVLLTRQYLAEAEAAAGAHASALARMRQNLPFLESQVTANESSVTDMDDLSLALIHFGTTLAATGDKRGAAEAFRRALPMAEEVVKKAPHNIRFKIRHAASFFKAGKFFMNLARAESNDKNSETSIEACSYLSQSLAFWKELAGAGKLGSIYVARPDEVAKELKSCVG